MCWSNKLTGKMVLVLLREEWISLFGRGTIQRYVFMLSTRLVRTSRNGLYRKMWSHFFLPHACDTKIFFLMLETDESISEIDTHHILLEAPELWSCN